MESKQITFYIPANILQELTLYTIDDLGSIAKNLFLEWHRKTFKHQSFEISETLESHQQKLRCTIDDSIGAIKTSIVDLTQTTKDVFGLSKTSQKKGELMEQNIYELFQTSFQNYCFEHTNHIPHCGDALLITPENEKILVEIKNYKNVVDQKEINKLKYDMNYNKIKYGLFLSVQSGIVGKKSIDIETYTLDDTNYTIVYVSYIIDESHKIHSGIALIESLMKLDNVKGIQRFEFIENKILNTIKEVTCIVETFSLMKTKFSNLEKIIKDQLNDHYIFLREYEYKMKTKLQDIWDSVMNDIKGIKDSSLVEFDEYDNILKMHQNCDVYTIMIKLFELYKKYNIKLLKKDDTSWIILDRINNIGEMKKYKQKIDLCFNTPNVTIKLHANKILELDYKFIESIFIQSNI